MLAQQDGSFDLEYILVDGGSTDGSPEIIRRYADRFSWWVSEADNGQAEAINKGFRHAHGEIVAWLNSDDLYLPGAISSAVKAFQSDPALGMVFGNAITVDAQGIPLNRLVFGDWGLAELARFRIICQPAVFMRRAVLEKAGYLDLGYNFMLDHYLWLRMAALAPIRHVQEFWAAARQHPGAKNVAQASGFSLETMHLLGWLQSQPEYTEIIKENSRKIIGGAYRLSARYYLDGGLPGESLRDYARAFWYYPAYTLQHYHRIIFAVISLLGGRGLAAWYYRHRQPMDRSTFIGMENWPGLCLEKK